jgi:serpin B
MKLRWPVLVCLCGTLSVQAGDVAALQPAAGAVNALGCDLLTQAAGVADNALLSPYSIQAALAMTYAGAAGATREEMERVLHFGNDEDALHRSFAALQKALDDVARDTAARVARNKADGGGGDPVTLHVANRLFGQKAYAFRPEFLDHVKTVYGAPLQLADFVGDARGETRTINNWVEQQTRDRIKNLIPEDALNGLTRLVLVNAVYLKAPWEQAFPAHLTKPAPFQTGTGSRVEVPTLNRTGRMGYGKGEGYTAVTVPYLGGQLQFLVLLPDDAMGLSALEKIVTPALLSGARDLPARDVTLYLPKLKLEPPSLKLSQALKGLGMRSAFDDPAGSADFDRMAPRKPDDYLCISEVFHKAFLELDEKGTEAAAATAVVMARATAMLPEKKPEPVVVRVDRPFVFAVQHRGSGACLFLGRVNDPRPSP